MPPWNVAKDVAGPGNATWIKALSPVIAEPLAAMLEREAHLAKHIVPGCLVGINGAPSSFHAASDQELIEVAERQCGPALALARLILEASDG
jgi:hypothetical protein